MLHTIQLIIALTLSAVFIALAVLHVAWALGFKWGGNSLLPQKPDGTLLFNPGTVACFIVALVFVLPALIYLMRVGILATGIPDWVPSVGVWGIALVLLVRAIGDFRYAGLTKKIKNTSFARRDTRLYTPLCLVLAALSIVLQLL
ncbi:MAG: DUF3995 domain-containing protein [Coriobacteriales bacterium]|jgi:hypothetical protein|nr:DUF3995 domain-containing protein [Coriobacteriales bacterium]